MNLEQLTATLQAWEGVMLECELQMDALSHLAGVAPEAPLPAAVYALMGEHNFGERPMNIGFTGEPMREISSIEALAQFIADDLERSSYAN